MRKENKRNPATENGAYAALRAKTKSILHTGVFRLQVTSRP